MLKGIAASSGIGIGNVRLIEHHLLEYTPKTVTDAESEIKRFHEAVEVYCKNTEMQANMLKESVGENEAEIIRTHISIIHDPTLIRETENLIRCGQCAESAFESTCNMFISIFSSAEEEITRGRATDVFDVKMGVMSLLIGAEELKLNNMPKGTILAAEKLTPSMTAAINKENIVGIITETGNTTSHSAILARVLEIPAVLSVPNVMQLLKNGDTVIVDGSKGELLHCPDDEQLKKYKKRRKLFLKERLELKKFKGKPTVSASGEKYKLFCNLAMPDDSLKTVEHDGEGAGLFRTEFMFMDQITPPTEEKQFTEYRRVLLMLKGRPLTIRTLDIGGDKYIPCLRLSKEENPFMGVRGIRYCIKNRDVFRTQLRAILRASAFGDISIMLPMISCIEELRESKALIEEIKTELRAEGKSFDENIKVGIMIETASAAVTADILAKEADFFSIGTNDLTGYTMACDRDNGEVSYLYSVFQPSVLRMIKRTIECGRENGIPVGMCGEAAADPMLIPVLISFGLTLFSVSAPSVLRVRKYISEWTKQRADEVTEKVMSLETRQETEAYLRSILSE